MRPAPTAPTSDRLDAARLALAWINSPDPRVLCVACGNLRAPDAPPCRCRLEAMGA